MSTSNPHVRKIANGKGGLTLEAYLYRPCKESKKEMIICASANLDHSLANVGPDSTILTSFSFRLKDGKEEGLLVAILELKSLDENFRRRFINRIYREEGKIILDENLYSPLNCRILQSHDDGTIYTVIGKVIYTSRFIKNARFEQRLVGGDLLCEYALGEIDAEALLRAVEEVESRRDELAIVKQACEGINKMLNETFLAKEEALDDAKSWKKLAKELKKAISLPRYWITKDSCLNLHIHRRKESVKNILKKFPSDSALKE